MLALDLSRILIGYPIEFIFSPSLSYSGPPDLGPREFLVKGE